MIYRIYITPATLRFRVAGFVRGQLGGWLWGGGLLALYRCILIESDQGEHFAGFFAGLCVYEEVFHEDLRCSGVRGAVLVVEVFFDVVLFADCFERLGDLGCLAVGTGDPVGLWSGCHYDKLEVSCVLRFSFEFECELGWGESYDENVRGRRLVLSTTALRSPPLHPEDRL